MHDGVQFLKQLSYIHLRVSNHHGHDRVTLRSKQNLRVSAKVVRIHSGTPARLPLAGQSANFDQASGVEQNESINLTFT